MPQEGVRRVIGKMISDPGFRAAVTKDPHGSLEGYHLSTQEVAAIAKIKPSDLNVAINTKPGSTVAVIHLSTAEI